ncbi:putative MFS family arabinose efflux permease [Raoultella sp. BIGb0149]|uniref:MFS transporter n=1 Tax=Raoultella TaxID=160674 RepID=UPI00105D4995|nr:MULTISPECIES: MFS transporter [Raoultella]TDQ21666.1 putative MFS family arabinose efflux permease [Raoultella sp. BIGb0149]
MKPAPNNIGLRHYLPILLTLPLAGLAELASLYSIQALLPKLAEVYHIPLNQVGLILSAEVGCLALAMLFTGSLSDRFGRKQTIVVSLLLGGILTLMCTTVSAWPELVLYRALLGLAVSGITAAVTVYICEEVSPALAGVVTGYFIFGNSLGSMSGRVFATLMMEQVSLNVIFMLFGGLLIFMALYVLYFLPASKNFTPSTALNLTQMLKGGIEHFKNRNISLAYVIGFILFGSFTSIFNFVAFYLHREPFNLSFTHIGLIPVSFALTFFSAPTTARLAVRFGAMNMLSMLLLVMITGAAISIFATTAAVFIFGVVVLSVAFFTSHSTILSWVSGHASHAKGQATAFYLFCYYAGGAVLGYLNGFVFAKAGWNGLALAVISLLAIGLLLSRILHRLPNKQRAVEAREMFNIGIDADR